MNRRDERLGIKINKTNGKGNKREMKTRIPGIKKSQKGKTCKYVNRKEKKINERER